MKLTAPFPVSSSPIGEKSILPWINDEARRLLDQLRTFANMLGWERHTADSDGAGTYVRIWTSPAMPSSGVWRVTHETIGRSSSGAVQWAAYEQYIVINSTAGLTTVVVANTNIIAQESAAAIDVRLAFDHTARAAYLEARDDATSPMHWTSVIRTQEGLAG